ncbi:cytochrome c, partial [Akkermansiaceae bacterium]|nr:cytochrome c [Akkermansiaceae bacterium]
CATCHQPDGEGLPAAMFPPLSKTKWVQGSPERLIKLTMHGLLGPIEIKGKKYPGQVPMTAFKGLTDEEMAAALTYVRNTFGNSASMISPTQVKAVREATKFQEGFYAPADLLKEHPHK